MPDSCYTEGEALSMRSFEEPLAMKIQELYEGLDLSDFAPAEILYRDGRSENKNEMLIAEHLIHVYVNDVLTMKLVCTPQYLTELVLGRLLTEGMIRSAEDVLSIYICEHGARARVFLVDAALEKNPDEAKPLSSDRYVEQDPTCCTDNHVLNDTFLRYQHLFPLPATDVRAAEVFALADHFKKGSALHSLTGGAHSCTLAIKGTIRFTCEDIGRHNALDKAIGFALRNGLPLSESMVYSSGRIPVDMARKAILAGIPVLVSKAVPTRQAVTLAREYGLTLLCSARSDTIKRYS